jgi:hypothetical protein
VLPVCLDMTVSGSIIREFISIVQEGEMRTLKTLTLISALLLTVTEFPSAQSRRAPSPQPDSKAGQTF